MPIVAGVDAHVVWGMTTCRPCMMAGDVLDCTPEPEGPRNAVKLCGSSCKLTPSTATLDPWRVLNVLLTSRTCSSISSKFLSESQAVQSWVISGRLPNPEHSYQTQAHLPQCFCHHQMTLESIMV